MRPSQQHNVAPTVMLDPAATRGWRLSLMATAALAAAASYGVHHVGPLDAHLTAEALLAIGAVSLAAALLGVVIAPERPAAPIIVLGGRPVHVSDLEAAQVPFCAALHRTALSHGFFAALGPRFLRKYYRTFVDSPHAVAVAATVEGHLVGYLVGVVRAQAHRRWVLQNRGLGLAFTAAAALSIRPGTTLRFARTRLVRYARRLRRHRDASAAGPARVEEVAVLSHVAVAESARCSGAGAELVDAFERASRAAGAPVACLTTLDGPDGAGPFYARFGWRPGPMHDTPDGRRMQEWTKPLEAEPTA